MGSILLSPSHKQLLDLNARKLNKKRRQAGFLGKKLRSRQVKISTGRSAQIVGRLVDSPGQSAAKCGAFFAKGVTKLTPVSFYA